MCEARRLTPEQIESMAVEIREFLLEYDMWIDTAIFFNGKCFTTYDPAEGKHFYNDREHLIVLENEDPKTYFDYVAEDHILSMSFEGPTHEMINNYAYGRNRQKKFNEIFEKYRVYYEQGNSWNLSCYYI